MKKIRDSVLFNLLFNVFLALVWCGLTESLHPWNVLAGLAIGAPVVSVYTRVTGGRPYVRRLGELLSFAWYFLRILVKANAEIAREVITPGQSQRPRILRYPVNDLNDVQLLTLTNAITLTPGTLVVDVSPCRGWIYIHCMYAQDEPSALAEIDELADRLRKQVFAA
jgi:multicomponent Na+:H+ antiporter subunit E